MEYTKSYQYFNKQILSVDEIERKYQRYVHKIRLKYKRGHKIELKLSPEQYLKMTPKSLVEKAIAHEKSAMRLNSVDHSGEVLQILEVLKQKLQQRDRPPTFCSTHAELKPREQNINTCDICDLLSLRG